MGKSTASCFKIMSCAGESMDHDDLQTPEGKGSIDRRRWSFRKKSAQHRVLSNIVASEAPLSVNKENPESPPVNISVQPDSTVSEKPSVIQFTGELTESLPQLDSNISETTPAVERDCKKDTDIDESSIIIIQAAIRRTLAQQVLLNRKNIIKLQAAVRGHIVRRHAVGTLRCVQAIIKMQALVRARRAGRLDNNDSTLLGKKETKANTTHTYVSMDKLLTNAFARQLMESTPRNKSINIKCDLSKPDSAWKWLERWMSASSASSTTGSPESESESDSTEHLHENLGLSDGQKDILIPIDSYAASKDMKPTSAASAEISKASANKEKVSLSTNRPFKSTGNGVPGNTAVSAATSAILIGSECGTELSISSTLDSPDRSEAGAVEIEMERKVPDEAEPSKTEEKLDTEAVEKKSAVECLNSINAENSLSIAKKKEAMSSDLHLEVESEASPRSRITIPESQVTPGSLVSVKPKKSKGKRSDSSGRNKSSSVKNDNQDTGSKVDIEESHETKAGKRRNSFDSGSKPDHKEREPRDSSSTNTIPSYMLATESTRARAIVNGSLRSSPDMHDKDIYIKKRHSLPGTNERQGSPRIQRSLSQAQQNTKGAAAHSPQDRKWQR